MKITENINNEELYGSSSTGPLVSFGFGTVQQAWDDRTVGGINYGYHIDEQTGRDYGVQYMEGMLISSRVLDISFGENRRLADDVLPYLAVMMLFIIFLDTHQDVDSIRYQ